ncbi:MAG: hypothetical protein E6R08_01325, partial [Nevskiaceae bacterium]
MYLTPKARKALLKWFKADHRKPPFFLEANNDSRRALISIYQALVTEQNSQTVPAYCWSVESVTSVKLKGHDILNRQVYIVLDGTGRDDSHHAKSITADLSLSIHIKDTPRVAVGLLKA